VRFLKICSGRN